MDAVLNWLWQGGVVARVCAMLTLITLDRTRANVRYMVCWAAALFVSPCPHFHRSSRRAQLDAVGAPQSNAIVALPEPGGRRRT